MKIHHHQPHLVQYWRVHTGLHPWSIGHTAGCTRHAWRRKPCGNGGWDPPDFWLKWRRKWWKNNGGEVADLIFGGIPNFLGFPMAENNSNGGMVRLQASGTDVGIFQRSDQSKFDLSKSDTRDLGEISYAQSPFPRGSGAAVWTSRPSHA